MTPSPRLALLLLLLSICVTPSSQAQTPQELQGKWKLRGSNRLLGTLEIKADGTYSYSMLPNYRETGKLTLVRKQDLWEIDLSITAGRNKRKTSRGILSIKDSKLQLCLGKLDGPRPQQFNGDPKLGVILWDGFKTQ